MAIRCGEVLKNFYRIYPPVVQNRETRGVCFWRRFIRCDSPTADLMCVLSTNRVLYTECLVERTRGPLLCHTEWSSSHDIFNLGAFEAKKLAAYSASAPEVKCMAVRPMCRGRPCPRGCRRPSPGPWGNWGSVRGPACCG